MMSTWKYGLVAVGAWGLHLQPQHAPALRHEVGHPKVRAVLLITGEGLAPRLIDDSLSTAPAVYVSMANALRTPLSRIDSSLSTRPCIEVDVFLNNARNADVPSDELRPVSADRRYLLFPGVRGKPPILMRWLYPVVAGQAATVYSGVIAELDVDATEALGSAGISTAATVTKLPCAQLAVP